MLTVKFKNWECVVQLYMYTNERPEIVLLDAHSREVVAKATVNIPEEPLAADEVLIRDYAENEGVLQSLIEADIIEHTGRKVQVGFCKADVCRLKVLT